jgi:predicted dehydrogenase
MWTEIYGTKGGATQRNINGTYTFQLQLHKSYGDYHTVSRPLRANPFKPSAMDHFFECVQYDREPIPSAEKGLEIQKILNGLYESARTGREVVFR